MLRRESGVVDGPGGGGESRRALSPFSWGDTLLSVISPGIDGCGGCGGCPGSREVTRVKLESGPKGLAPRRAAW